MSINLDLLQTIAKLAYIEISNDTEIMLNKLLSIDKAVKLLKEISTNGIEPFKHEHFTQQNIREDVVTIDNNREKLAKLAPKFSNDAYQIPIVLSTNTGK